MERKNMERAQSTLRCSPTDTPCTATHTSGGLTPSAPRSSSSRIAAGTAAATSGSAQDGDDEGDNVEAVEASGGAVGEEDDEDEAEEEEEEGEEEGDGEGRWECGLEPRAASSGSGVVADVRR